MKRHHLLLPLIALLIIWAGPAMALPTLQLDISDGTYDPVTETIIATSNTFTLYALLNDDWVETDIYYISAALVPTTGDPGGTFGSFGFNGETINATGDMTYGTPSMALGLDLPTHDVFPTYYTEVDFTFTGVQVGKYNTQDEPGGFADYIGQTGLYYAAFEVDVANLMEGYAIHFDLYHSTVNGGGKAMIEFAPFSHDAQSVPIPEPSTMLMLGTGLLGIAGISRKWRKLL